MHGVSACLASRNPDRIVTDNLHQTIMEFENCKHENLEEYGDGMCYEGCCDRYRCKDCGKIILDESAD